MIEYISSRQNPKILEALALRDRKTRREKGLFYFEGEKLLGEAIKRETPLDTLFLRSDAAKKARDLWADLPGSCRIYEVSDSVYDKLTEEKSPEGVFCISKTIDKYHKFATIYGGSRNFAENSSTLLMVVSLRDPGNLGSILRSAAAFGCGGLILSADCADLYGSKTVRASMGALFDLPVLTVSNPPDTVTALKEAGYAVYGGALDRTAMALSELSNKPKCCFVIGNEGHGLPDELLERCTSKVFIPMTEKSESLNASVAAAILLYSRYSRYKE